MVDILALAVSHGLLLIAAFRLLSRADLDVETRVDTPIVAPPDPDQDTARPLGRRMKLPTRASRMVRPRKPGHDA